MLCSWLGITNCWTSVSSLLCLSRLKKNRTGKKTYGPRLDLDCLTDLQCIELFRFTKAQRLLTRRLGLPDEMRGPNGCVFSGLEGLCVLLRRLCYRNRLCDLEGTFGLPKCTLSIISNVVCLQIFNTWGRLLEDFAHQPWFTEDVLQSCVDAVNQKANIPNGILDVWGFIDGTLRECCKPGHDQRVYYSGHKRSHGLKYQGIVPANGLFVHLFGLCLAVVTMLLCSRRADSHNTCGTVCHQHPQDSFINCMETKHTL